jgi:hypothetical protein
MDTDSILAALTAEPEWALDGVAPVPMIRWGKDHWTTFAYVESRWVDYHGTLDHDRMRCDRARHGAFYAAKSKRIAFGTNADGAKYPTRLKTEHPGPDGVWGSVDLPGHDDYDCLNDAITAGLLDVTMPRLHESGIHFTDAWNRAVRYPDGDLLIGAARPPRNPKGDLVTPPVTGFVESWLMTAASFQLTPAGERIAGELRAHEAATRRSHQFMPAGIA